MSDLRSLPALQPYLHAADHFDEKHISGPVSLRQFIAGMMTYQPGWITLLYRVRGVFVRTLGMKQQGVPTAPRLRPEDVAFSPDGAVGVFKVVAAAEDAYWIAGVTDKHLTAYLAVATAQDETATTHFYVGTIVHYHNWAGPVYFNVIRPFHHLVVSSMMQAGARHTA